MYFHHTLDCIVSSEPVPRVAEVVVAAEWASTSLALDISVHSDK